MDHLRRLAAHQARFAAALRTADLDAPVAGCAPWTAADLGLHLTGIHAWAADKASGDQRDQGVYLPTGPRTRSALVAAYEERAAQLCERLAGLDPAAPCWTLAGEGTTVFWRRRQLHETAMHLWDLESASGAPTPYDPVVAADGVDEVATVFTPRQVRLGRIAPLPYALSLTATDTGDSWQLGDGAPGAQVSGTAQELLLGLWHRAPLAADERAAAILALALTP